MDAKPVTSHTVKSIDLDIVEVTIRRAEAKDIDDCFALEQALSEERPLAAQEGFLLSGDARKSYDQFLSCGPFYVSVYRGKIIGFVFALAPDSDRMNKLRSMKEKFNTDNQELLDSPSSGWLAKVGVHPDYMGKGIATAMYERLFKENPSFGYLTTTVKEPVRNVPSEMLQAKFGFTVIGELFLGDRGSFKAVRCFVHYRAPNTVS